MTTSTNLVSGLSSGFDWASVVDQLMEIERQPVNRLENSKADCEGQLAEWQSFNTSLLALKTAAQGLQEPDDFFVYASRLSSDNSSVDASDLLSVTTSSSANQGSYSITINSLATAQKLSSASFGEFDADLGSAYAGDILINGRAVTISASDDLTDVRDKINNANAGTNPTGVTATIITYSENDYRLTLTSDETGEDGISLLNGSATDLIELFGWKDDTSSLKNSITGGAQSDAFSSSTQGIQTLLGLSTVQSGTIEVAGQVVSVDFSTDSLDDIRSRIDGLAGVAASIVPDTTESTTTYRLQVDGTQDFLDDQNILETLGILHKGITSVQGTTSANAMTSQGTAITASTLLTEVDGYLSWTSGDSIDISGTDHGNIAVSDTFNITASSTVQDLLDSIEAAFEANGDSVSTHITSDGTIEVADLVTGESALSVSLSSTVADGDLDWGAFSALGTVRERELVQGADAEIEVDGIALERSGNTIEDLIPGVTMNLLQADTGTTLTLNIAHDIDAIMEKMQTFVDAYNEISAYIHDQQSYDEESETVGGVLFGDGTLASVKSDLTSILIQSVWGVDSEFSIPGQVGINLDNEGNLSIDESTLRGYLDTNFNDIKLLFAANGTTSSGTLEYITYDRETEEGEYEVSITQVATQSAALSDATLPGALGQDETLTVTEDGKIAVVSLTSDMILADIVHALNTEFQSVYTEALAGSEAVTADASPAASGTAWGDIDGGQLVDGDAITFSGTMRNGSAVSGSYSINDTASDTIQGLLSEIETAYGSDVTATLDSAGRIMITDKYSGTSQLTLAFDYTETTNQVDIFGTVLTSNPGGQEGRYALAITASGDDTDHLVLTHDAYGSGHGFSISEDTDAGLFTGSQTTPAEAVDGVDVAGTINGESATGSGQTLTGDSEAANTAGLVLKYTGETTGEVGTVTLTLGVGEIFDRTLYAITDSTDGYVAFKQDSLEERIGSLESQIEDMEARLDQEMERMMNSFISMELALSQLQSQSQWLTTQLSNLGWSG